MNTDFMYALSFSINPLGIFPQIPLPEDYRNLVSKFEEQNRMKDIEDFARGMNEFMKDIEDFARGIDEFTSGQIPATFPLIRLRWESGLLRNIGFGAHGGLDLEEQGRRAVYVAHNLGGLNGIYLALVAINYVSELTKARD